MYLNANDFFDTSKIDLNLINDILNDIPDEYPFKPILREKFNKLVEQDLIDFKLIMNEKNLINFSKLIEEYDTEVDDTDEEEYTDEQIDDKVNDILKQEHTNQLLLKQIKQLDYNQFEEIVIKILDKLPFKSNFFKNVYCDEIMIKSMYNVVQNDFRDTDQVIESSILNGIQSKSQEYQQMLNKILE